MRIICRSQSGLLPVVSLVILALSFSTSMSLISPSKVSFDNKIQVNRATDASGKKVELEGRREFLRKTQKLVISCMAGMDALASNSIPAIAADTPELPTKEVVTKCFDFIRFELENPNGGVSYMQGKIDKEDFDALLDFSKTYDLEFRKRRFGDAKKLLQDKDVKAKATEYANAVTFDLIGINRSCRKGNESVESANKYLQELREDVTKFLALEKTIQVQ